MVVRCEATQFAATVINHSVLSSDEMRSVEMKPDEVRMIKMFLQSHTIVLFRADAVTVIARSTCGSLAKVPDSA